MQILADPFESGLESKFKLARPSVVAIGKFDGLHLGHQSLIQAARALSLELDAELSVLSFVQTNRNASELLFQPEQKLRALRELSVRRYLQKTLDPVFSALSPEAFFHQYLLDALHAKGLVVGENFRYGRDREGDVELLSRQGKAAGVRVHIVPGRCAADDQMISSTRVRAALTRGEVELAAEWLGRPYLVEGRTKKGEQLGRQLGVPTMNLDGMEQLVPKPGVYCAWAQLNPPPSPLKASQSPTVLTLDRCLAHPAVVSVGFRPTIAAGLALKVEAHLLDWQAPIADAYDWTLGLYFAKRLRDELRFESLDELKAAMAKDLNDASAFFGI